MAIFKAIGGFLGKGILGNIFGMVKDWVETKRQLKLQEASLKQTILLEKEKRISTQQNADILWDNTQAEMSKNSWKDEAWTITFIFVFLASFFVPSWAAKGWETLGNIPDFWQYALASSIAASFATKELFKRMPSWRKKEPKEDQ